MQIRRNSLALLVAAACNAAGAAETTLKDTVVTATLSEHDTATAPASVTVITREDLETRNATDLLDAVRGTPGVTLSPRQVGGRKTISLRGLEGKHTLTLIDGRRISPSDDVVGHSDYQYGWMPIAGIERIEIIRGPMSTLYGSEALGGVINIITRPPEDHWIGTASVSGSGLINDEKGGGGQDLSVFAAGPVGERLNLRLLGETSRKSATPDPDDKRYSEIEGHESRSVGIGATLKLTGKQTLEADWNDGHEERFYDDVATTGAKQRYENRYFIERSQGHLTWRGDFDGWRGQVRAYRSEIDITNRRTNGVAATRPQNLSDNVVDGFAALTLGDHLLTVGGEWREEKLENAGLIGGKDDATHKAVFAQDEFALARNLTLTAGVRVDDHEFFGSETSPRAYLVWEAAPGLIVKGGYGHAFKAPTLKQISPSYIGSEGPHTFMGNGDLKPETSDSVEIGATWSQGPLSLRGTLFYTWVDDLITYRLINTQPGPPVRRTYIYDNVNEARIGGLEGGFTWDITQALAWNTDITLLRTEDKSTGKELDDRPNASIASRLDWDAGNDWSARFGLEYTGTQNSAGAHLPAYTLWNVSIGKRIDKTFSLRAGINNLTDVRLADKSADFGYAEDGRTLYVTLRAVF